MTSADQIKIVFNLYNSMLLNALWQKYELVLISE